MIGKIEISGLKMNVEKKVAEFNINDNIFFKGTFKIKIFKKTNKDIENSFKYVGYSNLCIKDPEDAYISIGYGNTIEDTLKDTLECYLKQLSYKPAEKWLITDFERGDMDTL